MRYGRRDGHDGATAMRYGHDGATSMRYGATSMRYGFIRTYIS